ncbi:MAG TPA: sugar transferase, partial [Elusimicrobiota bacterium]|nr:sugar transferase [Elusimicrobiota bacterium]
MNLSAKNRIGATTTVDFVIMAVAWIFFALDVQTVHTPIALLMIWALLTTSVSIMLLAAIGYFDRYLPKPTWTGILSLALALPASAIYSKWVLVVMTHIPLVRYREILLASAWVSVVFELTQWGFFEVHRALGRRLILVTYVQPGEFEALKTQIDESGADSWISLKPASAAGNPSPILRGDEILVISRAGAHHLKNHPELLSAHLRGQRIIDLTQLIKEFLRRVNLRTSDAWTFLLGSSYQHLLNRLYFDLKSLLEPMMALALMILLSPIFLVIMTSLYLTSGRPIFYRQERLGYRGKVFSLLKFRTMPLTAESTGPQWASVDDPRVTPLGRWLRKTRLDELPQLINVLQGQLSFVGPRPERP